MARSSYIYMVMRREDGIPYSAWTVKHECVGHLKLIPPAIIDDFEVTSFTAGLPTKTVSASAFLDANK